MKFKSLLITILLSGMAAWLHPACAFDFHVSTPQEFQAALSAAGANGGDDNIFLAAGTYVGNFKYQPSEANALTIKPEEGTTGGQVVLDGDNLAYVLMLNADGLAADFVLEGLVLQNGNSTNGGGLYLKATGDVSIENCSFEKNTASSYGGGCYITGASSVTFSNNNITENDSSSGGGCYITGASSVTFSNNNITENDSSSGGGVSISYSSSVIFSNNNINENDSYFSGGGVSISYSSSVTFSNNNINDSSSGGGVSISNSSSVTFSNNNITRNVCNSSGGGFYIFYVLSVTFSNNNITGNYSKSSNNGGGGYIVIKENGSLYFINNSVSTNKADGNGGGVYLKLPDTTGTLHVYNNIIWANTATGEGDDIYVEGYGAETNFYNNTYSDMKAIWDNQGGNKTLDPQFFDPDNGDFHLKPTSPCIDTGHPGAPELPATDMEGNARVGIVDMGAYEHSTTALHPADTNQNWILELSEFNAYNTAWRNSTDWSTAPSTIPMDYVTRAGYLSKSGGTYHNTGSNRPMCWTPGGK